MSSISKGLSGISAQCLHSFRDGKHYWSILKQIREYHINDSSGKYACLLLNITENSFKQFDNYKYIWDGAHLKIAVDGSANCLAKRRIIHEVDIVCGDFDSINPNLLQVLRSPSTKTASWVTFKKNDSPSFPLVIETPSQKETDFTKAIHVAISRQPEIKDFVCLYHSDGKRMDHLFGMVNTLHLIKKNITLINVTSNSVSWLLQPGSNLIQKPKGQELCSLVPFLGPTMAKSHGLMYELNFSSPLEFGGLVSTSNFCKAESESIFIQTNKELLWTIELVDDGQNEL